MKRIIFSFITLLCAAVFMAQMPVLPGVANPAGSVGGGTQSYTVVQFKAANSNTNAGANDNCSGVISQAADGCHFDIQAGSLYGAVNQGTGNVAFVGFGAQAISIAAAETLTVTDTGGNTWTHCVACLVFFSGNAKTSDLWYTDNTTGSAGNDIITIALSNMPSAGERVAPFYGELHPSLGSGTGIFATSGSANLTSCGASGTPCNGVTAAQLSPSMGAGSNYACVVWDTDGPTEASVNSPWSTNYTNNGDHTGMAMAVGLSSSYTVAQFTAASSSAAITTEACWD